MEKGSHLRRASLLIGIVAAGYVFAASSWDVIRAQQATPAAPTTEAQRELLDTYCVTCHNETALTGGLALDVPDVADPAAGVELWETVVRKLRAGAMPPSGMPRPDQLALDGFVAYLETSLDEAAARNPNPGRSLARRMNRSEYEAVVSDLLALDVDAAQLLPPDDEAFGFDNIADQLKISPSLIERYLSAAWKVSHVAVGAPDVRPEIVTYRVRGDATQRSQMPGLPLGTQGGMTVRHTFPLDGEYVFRIRLWRTAFENAEIRGLDEVRQVEYVIDGERVFLGTFGGPEDQALDRRSHALAATTIENRLEARIPLKAGEHEVTIAFLKSSDALPVDHVQDFERSNEDVLNALGVPHLDRFTISGPFNGVAPQGVSTDSRRAIFTCEPATQADEEPCARQILASLARGAYRQSPSDERMQDLLVAFRAGRESGSFDLGIARAIRTILTDPEFYFRFEIDPAGVAPGEVYSLGDLELATRLSFFLWSSIPDDELLDLAEAGRLTEPAVLQAQVRRMLADPRSEALVKNFAGQWLYLRNLRNKAPDPHLFPDFDDNLRQAMERETELFFEAVMREDRSMMDLLTADFTFINDRLARHYGIDGVVGDSFQRVTLTDRTRWGILGKASTLTVTSHTTRTSPVVRGKWILEQLLGTPPAPPPPNVPVLTENGEDGRTLSLRQRMEEHRANPVCASCHRLMDPPGFALENFNAIGQWRPLGDDGQPVDAQGQLADGTVVDGVVGLRNAITAEPELFMATITEKLLIYALGRGVEASDMPAIRQVVRDSASDDYRFSSVITGIVQSVPFLMKRAAAAPEAGLAASR